jgi:hypothetical protein
MTAWMMAVACLTKRPADLFANKTCTALSLVSDAGVLPMEHTSMHQRSPHHSCVGMHKFRHINTCIQCKMHVLVSHCRHVTRACAHLNQLVKILNRVSLLSKIFLHLPVVQETVLKHSQISGPATTCFVQTTRQPACNAWMPTSNNTFSLSARKYFET